MTRKKSRNYEFVSELLADDEVKKSIESLPCEIFEADGAFGFRFVCGDEPGIVALEFYAHGLADWALKRAKAVMRAVAADKLAGHANKTNQKTPPSNDDALVLAGITAIVFIKGMSGKMNSLLGELERETECYMYEVSHKSVNSVPRFDCVEQIAKEMVLERRRFLKGAIARFGQPRWNEMRPYYDELLPKAEKAKRLYEQNKKEENWRGMIKGGYPQFDDDLIILLSNDTDDLDNLLPIDVVKATKNSEDYSKASNMALEQSARLCGMKPFAHGPRTLRGRMDEHGPVKSTGEKISPKTPKARKRRRSKNSP